MNACWIKIGLALFALGTNAFADGYGGSEGERGAYICFASDTVRDPKADDDATDCNHNFYYRGQGICLSHAKKIALEKCTSFSKSRSSCRVETKTNCYVR